MSSRLRLSVETNPLPDPGGAGTSVFSITMRILRLVLLLPVIGACASTAPPARPKSTVLFLCPYGGAKSVIAASYFNRLAEERDLAFVAVAAAAEDPYPAVPQAVADYLQRDGIDVRSFKPRRVAAEEIGTAAKVVAIDCNLDRIDVQSASIERWDDVPKVSVDLDASAAAIRRHVEALAEALRGGH
jgi:arsenate reductase (thioredoxin)